MTVIDSPSPTELPTSRLAAPPPATTVTITPLREVYGETARDRFWNSVRNIVPNLETQTEELELRVQRRLGPKLREQLISHVFPNEQYYISSSAEPPLRAIAPITFSASIRGYHSAIIGIDITGINQLAHLFDDNFDAFAAFFTGYFPLAFADALGAPTNQIYPFTFDYAWLPSLAGSFRSSKANEGSLGERSGWRDFLSDRGKWYWMAVNGTLLVPAALAVGISWSLLQEAHAQREAAMEYIKVAIQHEQVLLSRFAERDAQLKTLNDALVNAMVKKLSAPESGAATPALPPVQNSH